MGIVGSVLGQGASRGTPVHVDVFHADQPGACGFSGRQHPGLQSGETRVPLVVGRVHRLIDDRGTPGCAGSEDRVGGVTGHNFDVVGYLGYAGAVDHADGAAAAAEGIEGGQSDGAGAEDDVQAGIHE
nr:hypothetical protein [Arthrobacter sp. P2b]